MEEMRNMYKILVWKSERKRPLGRPWDDNIKMKLKEIWNVWIEFIWIRIGTTGL
jgi:hypothetical protein